MIFNKIGNGDAQMKDILSYDEMKEKLEKIKIPDSVIDRVNEVLEIMVSTNSRVVGIRIGDKPGKIKKCYVLRLVQEIKKKGYNTYAANQNLWIRPNKSKTDRIENDGEVGEKEENRDKFKTKSAEKSLKKSKGKMFWQYVKRNYLWYVTFFVIPVVVCSLNNSARSFMVALTINLWLILCLYFCHASK